MRAARSNICARIRMGGRSKNSTRTSSSLRSASTGSSAVSHTVLIFTGRRTEGHRNLHGSSCSRRADNNRFTRISTSVIMGLKWTAWLTSRRLSRGWVLRFCATFRSWINRVHRRQFPPLNPWLIRRCRPQSRSGSSISLPISSPPFSSSITSSSKTDLWSSHSISSQWADLPTNTSTVKRAPTTSRSTTSQSKIVSIPDHNDFHPRAPAILNRSSKRPKKEGPILTFLRAGRLKCTGRSLKQKKTYTKWTTNYGRSRAIPLKKQKASSARVSQPPTRSLAPTSATQPRHSGPWLRPACHCPRVSSGRPSARYLKNHHQVTQTKMSDREKRMR